MEEIAEALLWFCLNAFIAAVGLGAAGLAMALCYFRGTKAGRFPLFCVFLALVTTVLCWLIFIAIDPPVSMIFAAATSIATFMALASWLGRYDRY